ncbi:MAG: hypothetical protein ACOCXM_05275 [Myxococcota bacterium]
MAWLAPRRIAARRLHASGAVLLSIVFASACTIRLPPAATPERVVPDADVATPPPEGQGRLVIDVVEGSYPVQQVRVKPEEMQGEDGRVSYELRETYEDLCDATPCVLDLEPGNLILGFPVIGDEDAIKIDLVHVGPETSVYRRSLAFYDERKGGGYTFGIVSAAVGASSMIAGLPMLPVGLFDDRRGLAIAGGATLGLGAALLWLGTWLIKKNSPTFRPGSWTHYPLSVEFGQP